MNMQKTADVFSIPVVAAEYRVGDLRQPQLALKLKQRLSARHIYDISTPSSILGNGFIEPLHNDLEAPWVTSNLS